MAVREQRHVRHHLLVDEFVFLGNLGGAVEHQHLAEEQLLEQDQVLVLGLHFVKHLVDPKAHAEAEIVEQGFGNPALRGHHILPYENGRDLARPLNIRFKPPGFRRLDRAAVR